MAVEAQAIGKSGLDECNLKVGILRCPARPIRRKGWKRKADKAERPGKPGPDWGKDPLDPSGSEWDMVHAATEPGSAPEALERLMNVYVPLLKFHVKSRFVLSAEQSEDWIQGFVLHKILCGTLLQNAESGRGKFRNYLFRALDNYIFQQLRKGRTEKRSPDTAALSIDALTEKGFSPAQQPELDSFDVSWARGLLLETLRRMKVECLTAQRSDIWGVFEARLLRPLVTELPPSSYDELAARFGFESAIQAANCLCTAKRSFARHLRALVASYVRGEGAIESEINDLKTVLLRVGAEIDSV